MNYKKILVSVIASTSLLANAALPVLATTIQITGNGTESENTVEVEQTSTTGVTQTNDASITNNVNLSASTGGNTASDNTSGNVTIKTGDATSKATVENTVNSNQAEVGCCDTGDVDVLISGNGTDTENKVEIEGGEKKDAPGVYITQDNDSHITNNVDAYAKAGKNEAEDNTGGDVEIDTGSATVNVTAKPTANFNSAVLSGSGEGGSLSAVITGNGEDSENDIDIESGRQLLIAQKNYASVNNDVDAYAKTGKNEAEDNTGGDVSIETGDAEADVTVENMVNFNWANMDCGCMLGSYSLKIGANGKDTKNKIDLDLGGAMWAEQGNIAGSGLKNDLDVLAKTGENEVEDGTGSVDGDPVIDTGDALIDGSVYNSGNSNVLGGTPDWPDFSQTEIHFDFDWAALIALLGLHLNG